jgi:hypothetical protein
MILRGRGLHGKAVGGEVLASRHPLSFLGGLDPATGIVRDPASDLHRTCLARKVLAFPHGKGSTVGSYVLYAACRRGLGPVAVVCDRAETIVAAGAVLAGIPLVDGVDTFALATGDAVELPDVREEAVASAFLHRGDRYLFLRRGMGAPTHPGLWSGVSGMVEGDEPPATRAALEVEEETKLPATLLGGGEPVYVRLGARAFRIHPFLFDCPVGEPRLNYENEEARWLTPAEVDLLPTVPRLRAALESASRSARYPGGAGAAAGLGPP